jgi:hypothetical protein
MSLADVHPLTLLEAAVEGLEAWDELAPATVDCVVRLLNLIPLTRRVRRTAPSVVSAAFATIRAHVRELEGYVAEAEAVHAAARQAVRQVQRAQHARERPSEVLPLAAASRRLAAMGRP